MMFSRHMMGTIARTLAENHDQNQQGGCTADTPPQPLADSPLSHESLDSEGIAHLTPGMCRVRAH